MRLFGDRDTDLGGNEIFMKPPKILVETKVVEAGVVWKIKKALYGLRTSPIAWETERDTTIKNLVWVHDDTEYRLLSCQGSPCLWTVVPIVLSTWSGGRARRGVRGGEQARQMYAWKL